MFYSGHSGQKKQLPALIVVSGTDGTRQIPDLAGCMVSCERALMQHYPSRTREHVLPS